MIALQEELDWQVYHLYGLLDEDLSLPPEEVPPLKLGERPFEIVMARQMAAGELETSGSSGTGPRPSPNCPRTGRNGIAAPSSGDWRSLPPTAISRSSSNRNTSAAGTCRSGKISNESPGELAAGPHGIRRAVGGPGT
jgi:hypothetical protein